MSYVGLHTHLYLKGHVRSCWGHFSSGLHPWRSCHPGWCDSDCHFLCLSSALSSGKCWDVPHPSASPVRLHKTKSTSMIMSFHTHFTAFRHNRQSLQCEKPAHFSSPLWLSFFRGHSFFRRMYYKSCLHSILYFSISCTSAMDSRRSSVNFLRSCGLGALKLMRTLMSAPGRAEVRRTPLG